MNTVLVNDSTVRLDIAKGLVVSRAEDTIERAMFEAIQCSENRKEALTMISNDRAVRWAVMIAVTVNPEIVAERVEGRFAGLEPIELTALLITSVGRTALSSIRNLRGVNK